MLSLQYIRDHTAEVVQAARDKNIEIDVDRLLELDAQRKELKRTISAISAERNRIAAQAQGVRPGPDIIAAGKQVKEQLQQLEQALAASNVEYQSLLDCVPNIPTADTPIGKDATANHVLRSIGEPTHFDFTPKEHWELGRDLGVLDVAKAARVAGSRFTYLMGDLVWLQFALVQYALTQVTDEKVLATIIAKTGLSASSKPFVPVIPPVMVQREPLRKMARLEPQADRYHLADDDIFLAGSAEHTLGPLHMDETLLEHELPIRYVGYSTCFRKEAGSYGKDVHGMLRVHQFDKLEMETWSTAPQGVHEQEFLVAIQEHVMQGLGLPYRVVLVATGDMGAPDARQIDIETWLPGQQTYRETHSADYMGDYQARRLRTKVKTSAGTDYVHMNDATLFAIGRTLIAVMENYQQADGSIMVPAALRPYTPFDKISAKKRPAPE